MKPVSLVRLLKAIEPTLRLLPRTADRVFSALEAAAVGRARAAELVKDLAAIKPLLQPRRGKRFIQALEVCVPNQGGNGHHDDKTGHPCITGDKDQGGKRDKSVKDSPKKRGVLKRLAATIKAKSPLTGSEKDIPPHVHAAVRQGIWTKILGGGKVVAKGGQKLLRRSKPVIAAAKAAAKRLGQKVFDKLPGPAKWAATKLFALVHWAEHKLEAGFRVAKAMVKQVQERRLQEERGLPEKHIERVSKIVNIADAAARWTINVPAAMMAIEPVISGPLGMITAKLGYYVPVASIAYVGYSTVRNPMATIRAAKKILAGKVKVGDAHQKAHTHEAVGDPKEDAVAALIAGMDRNDGSEWYQALVSVALDATHDLGKAVKLADAAIKAHPTDPSEKGGDGFAESVQSFLKAGKPRPATAKPASRKTRPSSRAGSPPAGFPPIPTRTR
jgi:hypothetical protein